MCATMAVETAERMVCANEIRDLAARIAAEFRQDRIILFGSHASGAVTEDSDVDLFVLMPFGGRALRASPEIANRVEPTFAVDILARRPDDTARRYALGDPLVRDVLDHGIVLYERDR